MEKKGSFPALQADGEFERQVGLILKMSQMAVYVNKVQQKTLRTTDSQTSRGHEQDDYQLTGCSLVRYLL